MSKTSDEMLEHEVSLKDVTEEGTLPEAKLERNSRKKKLMMMAALGTLLVATTVGAYFLLGGKEVQVRANRKPTEKVTNGADLQKAAYDSLRGSLGGPVTEATTSATNIGAGQLATTAMAGVTPTPVTGDVVAPKAAPAQPGIALTLAPPIEATAPKQTWPGPQSSATGGAKAESGTQEGQAGGALTQGRLASKPKVGASIVFTAPPDVVSASVNGEMRAGVATEAKTSAVTQHQASTNAEQPVLRRTQKATTPGFGAMLPVRSMGVLYTLRAGSLARFELARDVKAEGWALKRGTVFVGSMLGSDFDRAYVQIKGFIDPATGGFTRLEGETLGSDGGAGLRGKRRRVSPAWVKVLDRAAQSGTQILTGVLGRRDSSVIIAADPYGTYRSGTGYDQAQLQGNRTFVEVPAGSVGFILVTTLPEPNKADSHLAVAQWAKDDDAGHEMPEAELAELLAGTNPEKIREALPRMNPDLRRVAQAVLRELEAEKK